MNKSKFTSGRAFPVVFMLIITVVFIGITSSIYTITKSKIELNKTLNVKKAILKAAGFNIPQSSSDVEKLFERVISPIKLNKKIIYYKVNPEDKIKGYVFITSGPGLWGKITLAVGVDQSLQKITGIEIIDQVETPGLGGRITEKWFKNQFKGKRAPLEYVPEGEPTSDNEFQAITGATHTTHSIEDIINKLFKDLPNLVKS